MTKRIQLSAKGLVQGVGFRPFIYNLAKKFLLKGFVQNNTHGVFIDIEGKESDIDSFIECLIKHPPPRVIVENIYYTPLPPRGWKEFVIKESVIKEDKTALISADIAICQDCLNELFAPKNRRYRYPFINCTNCGPRFTIVKDIPYDRIKTTMSDFSMCRNCTEEYHDPGNRRFHAQPNACPVCGPRLLLIKNDGSQIPAKDPIAYVCTLLHKGQIIAIKGLGGYHLACDARNSKAVSLLRQRKNRDDKPFALMIGDIEKVKAFCLVGTKEEALLLSTQRPIVLLQKKYTCAIAPEVAPGNNYLGVMLPYTPVHYLILKESGLPLVMTSGNKRDEPIVYEDNVAYEKLRDIADYFLTHNRDIFIRCDDSITKINEGREMILRRSRGYAPFPLTLRYSFKKPTLACGAFLKNTFCLARDNHAIVSHHIGDLENTEAFKSFENGIIHYKRLFSIEPEIIAYDLHPGYLSTQYALSQGGKIYKAGIQHHHAHIVSCMAEHGIDHKVIGVAFDGLGYGEDGAFWGGEFLISDISNYERVGHLDYIPLPGGDQAIKEPWRMAISYLYKIYRGDIPAFLLKQYLSQDMKTRGKLDPIKLEILFQMLARRINSPLTSSVGRLFDGVASLIDICHYVTFEGQAAIKLESVADEYIMDSYPFDVTTETCGKNCVYIIHWQQIIEHIIHDIKSGSGVPVISARFHNSLADIVFYMCNLVGKSRKLNDVVLSGGVFQNGFLFRRLVKRLSSNGFRVFIPQKIPCNDGGISLGQAVIANERFKICV